MSNCVMHYIVYFLPQYLTGRTVVISFSQINNGLINTHLLKKELRRNGVDEPLKQPAGSLSAVVDSCQVGQEYI